MKYGLLGEKLSHSFSPAIHERISDIRYGLFEVPPSELGTFLRSGDFRGLNVTIPYKQAVIPYLDSLSESARKAGAVNVIVRREGSRLEGCNTDVEGFVDLVRSSGVSVEGSRVAILGAGGAARAVDVAVRRLGAAGTVFAVRTPRAPGQVPISDPSSFEGCDILVNATPAGMFPAVDGTLVDLGSLKGLRAVFDCIYNPLRTNLVLDAAELGIPAAGGLRMLAAQAVRTSELFRDVTLDDSVTDEVCRFLLGTRRNIVLCGMPSSGKTTVGRMLSGMLGKVFVDTDEVVGTHAGMDIPRIFELEGEAGFRARERVAVQQAASEQGAVIATGGGTVLDPANLRALRRSGLVIFLDRPPQLLEPSADRPLSSDRAALLRLYGERHAAYLQAADAVIPNAGTPGQAAEQILELYDK